jgi:hypothetical protein
MAWNSYPQGHKGYFWLHNPDVIFEAELDYSNTYTTGRLTFLGDMWRYLCVTNITTGAMSDIKAEMTLSIGTSAQGWDYGFCRVRGVKNVGGTDVIEILVNGNSALAGDLLFQSSPTLYVTVWDERRLWTKPPIYSDSGVGWYDGVESDGIEGPNYDHPPVANGGPPVMGWIDTATEVLSVDFDASRSYRVEHTAVLGSWTSDIAATATISSDSENGGNVDDNVVDGDTGTYWEPSDALPEGIRFTFSASKRFYRVDITASGNNAPKKFTIRPVGLYARFLHVTEETGWGSHETRTYYLDADYNNELDGTRDSEGHDECQIYIYEANGGTLRIEEVKIYAEDRTGGATQAYTWDFDDGTITTGDVNSEAPTVTFTPGFRWVSLTVEDSNSNTDIHWIPVLALGTSYKTEEKDYTSAIYDESDGLDGFHSDQLFDNDDDTSWAISVSAGQLPAWASVELNEAQWVNQYSITFNHSDTDQAPKAWELQAYIDGAWTTVDSQSGQTGWSEGESRSFTISSAYQNAKWRIYVTENNDDTFFLRFHELDLEYTLVVDQQELPLTDVELESRQLDIKGQTLRATIYEDISSYPRGAMVLYGEDEWFDGVKGACSEAEYPLVDRGFLKFWGWIAEEHPKWHTTKNGLVTSTRVICHDVGQCASQIPAWNLVFQRKDSPSSAFEMRHPNVSRLLWFAARYISNLANLTDFYWGGLGDEAGSGVLGMNGDSLFMLMDGLAQSAGSRVTCNKFGQIAMRKDQNIARTRNTTSAVDLTESDYLELAFSERTRPRAGILWLSGISTTLEEYDDAGFSISPWFYMAPGQLPTQGVQKVDVSEQIEVSDADLGRRALNLLINRHAAVKSLISFQLAAANDIGIDPADMYVVTLDLGADYVAQRGTTWSAEKFYPQRVVFQYNNEGHFCIITVEAEQYATKGNPAENYTP